MLPLPGDTEARLAWLATLQILGCSSHQDRKHVIQIDQEEEEPEREAWVPGEAELRSRVPRD